MFINEGTAKKYETSTKGNHRFKLVDNQNYKNFKNTMF